MDPFEETERFFKLVIWNVSRGNETPIRVQSYCPEDPQWITNAWGSKNVARKRPEGLFYQAAAAAKWVLGEKHGRLATVPSRSNVVVKLADTEAVDLGLDDPAACRLAFFRIVPTFVITHREAGTLHAVWLLNLPTAPPSLSDRVARQLKGTATKLIPVPGTFAHGGLYEFTETGLTYERTNLEAASGRS